ncbi:MAG: hypothetical protein ABEJ65_06730 [bacterium]
MDEAMELCFALGNIIGHNQSKTICMGSVITKFMLDSNVEWEDWPPIPTVNRTFDITHEESRD